MLDSVPSTRDITMSKTVVHRILHPRKGDMSTNMPEQYVIEKRIKSRILQ